jgi:putative hydrolase of the HAD superfamily
MINWDDIEAVMLDMDGTLLDLNFDTHFWQQHVPRRYAEVNAISLEQAREELFSRYRRVEGTMDWYCVDYWSRELDLDIALLKEEVDHLIAVFPGVRDFLDRLRARGKRVMLVTNAHQKSLQLKMDRTSLGGHLDDIVCAHDLGVPKEHTDFWCRLHAIHPFNPEHSLLIDDSPAVLRSARDYGFHYLLSVEQPDSGMPPRQLEEFDTIQRFEDIMP